jgi:hypothetical protein
VVQPAVGVAGGWLGAHAQARAPARVCHLGDVGLCWPRQWLARAVCAAGSTCVLSRRPCLHHVCWLCMVLCPHAHGNIGHSSAGRGLKNGDAGCAWAACENPHRSVSQALRSVCCWVRVCERRCATLAAPTPIVVLRAGGGPVRGECVHARVCLGFGT